MALQKAEGRPDRPDDDSRSRTTRSRQGGGGSRPSQRAASIHRKARIVEATRALVRERDFDKVLVADVAACAGVSVGTVYNLVGPRDHLFLAVLADTVDEIDRRTAATVETDGFSRCIQVGAKACEVLLDDAELHRPLLGSLYGFTGGDAPVPGLGDLFRVAVEQGAAAGDLRAGLPPRVVATQVHFAFRGVLWTWVEGQLEDAQFAESTELAMLFVLAGVASERRRGDLAARIDQLALRIAPQGTSA